MYLKCHSRLKDGKTHHYWNVVEHVAGAAGRRFERQVLYLGELGVEERRDWEARIERISGAGHRPEQLLFELPDERLAENRALRKPDPVTIRISEFSLKNPRQYGGCWMFCALWEKLGLDAFWRPLLPTSRKGTSWLDVLKILCANRLLDPSSEWRVHREWFKRSAMRDLLGCGEELSAKDTLYRCLDWLLEHKDAFFQHLRGRWMDMFNASCDVLLYDLTSTYFESEPPFPPGDKRAHGYSRDHRGDCVQIVIALVVTPEGLPVAYEVMKGNTADNTTLGAFLDKIEGLYGRSRRIWLMDRGIPTEESLKELAARGGQYVVGTPKGRLSKLEGALAQKPWQAVRDKVQVKLLEQDGEVVVYVESADRVMKERAMRLRRVRKLLKRLAALSRQSLGYAALLQKIGAARHEAGRDQRHVQIDLPRPPQDENAPVAFSYRLDCAKLREAHRREGRYLLRSNLTRDDPGELWEFYLRLGEVEQAFRTLKGDLGLRPIFHSRESRIESHVFVAFIAYCLSSTLRLLLAQSASGLTPRAAIEKLSAIQMIDVHFPINATRELVFSRYTTPEADQELVLDALGLELPRQSPPKITVGGKVETDDLATDF